MNSSSGDVLTSLSLPTYPSQIMRRRRGREGRRRRRETCAARCFDLLEHKCECKYAKYPLE